MRFGAVILSCKDGMIFLYEDQKSEKKAFKLCSTESSEDFIDNHRLYTLENLESFLQSSSATPLDLSSTDFTGDRNTLYRIYEFIFDVNISKAIYADNYAEKLKQWLENRERKNLKSDLLVETISLVEKISTMSPIDIYKTPFLAEVSALNSKIKRWQNNRANKRLSKKGLHPVISMLDQILDSNPGKTPASHL